MWTCRLFLPRAEHFRRHLPEMIGILSAALIIASCVLGCILGCTHTLPVHPIVALTAAKKGVLVCVPSRHSRCRGRVWTWAAVGGGERGVGGRSPCV